MQTRRPNAAGPERATRRACPWAFLAAGLLAAGQAAVAGEQEAGPPQPARALPAGPNDGLLPISQVVPRAKIVLKERERLPDQRAEETFAAFGSRTVRNFPWSEFPPVPMYGVAYHPIYLEDMNLERCGLTYGCLQPVLSGLHFYGGFAILPYKMLVSPPRSYVIPPGVPPDDCPPGYRFNDCENFFGPPPSLRRTLGR